MKIISIEKRNAVLTTMINLLAKHEEDIIQANRLDLDLFDPQDRAMYDRLIVDHKKVAGMIKAVSEVLEQSDPVGVNISDIKMKNGLHIQNRTSPFGTIMIIYESRPDVTIEAAVLAFKANNKILLKGGKEAIHSNRYLIKLWHEALETHGLSKDWITLLELDRNETQNFLKTPSEKLDLIVPRGGEQLINFVKEHATCAVLVSGRGNNFLYVHEDADWGKTIPIIINAKTQKISACNALDKVLINRNLPDYAQKLQDLRQILHDLNVEVLLDHSVADVVPNGNEFANGNQWPEEFLSMKAMLGAVNSLEEAVELINTHSGGHSTSIMTESRKVAESFMEEVDSAAVYHNASTRFTDGGQMGVGAELAISTDKLHHRGPLGLEQLVTNKYFVFGNGQVRE